MDIPKRPFCPDLSDAEIEQVSMIVFGNEYSECTYDAMLLFGGSHPGLWETAISLYKKRSCSYIFVTGGYRASAQKHASWTYGLTNEADVAAAKLEKAGIPSEIIIKETHSTNSYENVMFIRDEIMKKDIHTLLCICKSYAAGRQYRTIKQNLANVTIYVKGFDTGVDEAGSVTRDNWTQRGAWKSLIWGEYLRNYFYSRTGNILKDFEPSPRLQKLLEEVEREIVK